MITLKPVTHVVLVPPLVEEFLASSFNFVMSFDVSLKTLKSSCSVEASKMLESGHVGRSLSLSISGCGKVTHGGDRAARRCLSWQGMTTKGFLEAIEAMLSRKVLKLRPSKVVWLVEMPIAKPPHLKDVTCVRNNVN